MADEHERPVIASLHESNNSIHIATIAPAGLGPTGPNGQQYSVEYLSQLLKDKKQLAAFPNVFHHLERLADEEISKVRVALFQFEFTKEQISLPDAEGEIQVKTEKVFVPAKEHPDYNFVGRILGPRGMTAKQLEQETGCKIMVRGRGSMRDKKKVTYKIVFEELNRGKANWEHLSEELHVLIQCEDTPNRSRVKLARAVEEVKKLLIPAPEGEDELKRKQLMELAIINGTYRSATEQAAAAAAQLAAKQPLAAALQAAVNFLLYFVLFEKLHYFF
uniref:KH domain-containing protein n=1 Tax=Heterorhabditis bacteriophora TaxID=37862 RepID=A0A1I7WPM5_HETBA